jgi:hypothetical protein
VTRTMFDGIAQNAQAIAKAFPSASLIAGYVDGRFAWSTAQWDLFPHAAHVKISAIPGSTTALTADVADCETGDYTPVQAGSWVFAKKKAGYHRPTVYCSLSNAPQVRVATGSLVLGIDYDMWLALWDNNPAQYVFPDGRLPAAKQYNHDISGGIADISAVYPDGWPFRTAPGPAPSGPYRHVVAQGNTHSLYRIAADRGTDEDKLIALSQAHENAQNMGILNAYAELESLMHKANLARPTAPAGLVYYTENP